MSDSTPKSDGRALFLSYASQDAEAARRIRDALREAGVEVWFDQNELRGGDAWDAKIRKQIKECALFLPIISANTQSRPEGYFRLEWHLAEQRSHLIARGRPFIMPLSIDDTRDTDALVPDAFLAVQWTHVPHGVTSPAFVEQVKSLLAPSQKPGIARTDAGVPRASSTKQASGAGHRKPRMFLVLGGLAIFVVGIAAYLALRSRPGSLGNVPIDPTANPIIENGSAKANQVPAARSEAKDLVIKAQALMNNYNSSSDDYAIAENYIKRALELEANDGEIWATSSLLNTGFRTRGFDLSPTRGAAARSHAERALKLAPDSIDALLALGRWQRDHDPNLTMAEATFRKILALDPNQAGALNNLGAVYDRMERVDEALEMFRRSAIKPENRALGRYTEFVCLFRRARFAEAETAVRESIAAQPSTNSQSGLAMLLLTWKGDAAEAARALASGPASIRNEQRTIWVTVQVQLALRASDLALQTLVRLSDDYITDNWFTGPKAYWTGRAHALAGRDEAARVAWEAGLAIVETRLKREPDSNFLHSSRGELLGLLGRAEEALREARTVSQLGGSGSGGWYLSPVRIFAALGRIGDALPLIREQLQFTAENRNIGWPLTPALLRVDPLWDKLRGDPRFEQLTVERDVLGQTAVSSRDWPRDPELKRVMKLINGLESIPEDISLGEDVARKAVEKSPADPEAVTVMARVQAQFLLRGFDRSDERYAQARRYADRAVQLAPEEPEALFALSVCLRSRNVEYSRTLQLLRRACELEPNEPAYHRQLVETMLPEKPTEGLRMSEELAARFPRDALSQYDLARWYRNAGRIGDMEAALDRTIAIYPLANAIVWKARLRLWIHDDLAGMKALLDRISERMRSVERVVFSRFIHALVSGEVEDGLEALRGFPSAWIDDFDYEGPKEMLMGELLFIQGKKELARIHFESALAEVERQKTRARTALAPRSAEAWILNRLGRSNEARAGLRVVLGSLERPYRMDFTTSWMFQPIVLHLVAGAREDALQLIREASQTSSGRMMIRISLKVDPNMAPWRDDPEIKALLAETPDLPKVTSESRS